MHYDISILLSLENLEKHDQTNITVKFRLDPKIHLSLQETKLKKMADSWFRPDYLTQKRKGKQ